MFAIVSIAGVLALISLFVAVTIGVLEMFGFLLFGALSAAVGIVFLQEAGLIVNICFWLTWGAAVFYTGIMLPRKKIRGKRQRRATGEKATPAECFRVGAPPVDAASAKAIHVVYADRQV